MVRRKWLYGGFMILLVALLAISGVRSSSTEAASKTAKIKYLEKTYKVPLPAKRIVITGSMETMEDALVLGVKPTGGITVGGKFPSMFKKITGSTVPIGEKAQPNMETIVKLKPDVILASKKFPPDVINKLQKIAPTHEC